MKFWIRECQRREFGAPQLFRHGQFIVREKQPVDALYFLAEGTVEECHETYAGGSMTTQLIAAPVLLGLREALSSSSHHLGSLRVLGTAFVYRIELQRFHDIIATDPRAALEVMRELSLALALSARFDRAPMLESDRLLANLFVAYAELFGKVEGDRTLLLVPRSQQDFAFAIGTTERQVSRVLRGWKREGVVEKRAGRYVILDMPYLRRTASELEGSLVLRWTDPDQGVPLDA